MINRKLKWLTTVISILIFSACGQPSIPENSSIMVTTSSESTYAPATYNPPMIMTIANTPSPTPSATPMIITTPSPTEILPTPDFLILSIAQNLLLSTDYDPECKLPCWQGLRVGESDRDDVQKMFEEALGLNRTLDVFTDNPLREAARSVYMLDFEGIQPVGYEWQDLPKGAGIGIYILVDQNTGVLQGIQLHYVPYGVFHYPTPQDIILGQGQPNYMYVELRLVGPPSDGVVESSIQVIYNDGIALSTYFISPTETKIIDDKEIRTLSFCLNKPAMGVGNLVIVAPFDDLWSDKLSPIQQAWLIERNSLTATGRSFEPAEDVLGLSLDEITRIALEEDPPCFEVDVSHLFE